MGNLWGNPEQRQKVIDGILSDNAEGGCGADSCLKSCYLRFLANAAKSGNDTAMMQLFWQSEVSPDAYFQWLGKDCRGEKTREMSKST